MICREKYRPDAREERELHIVYTFEGYMQGKIKICVDRCGKSFVVYTIEYMAFVSNTI
jgi:hypothetical protein